MIVFLMNNGIHYFLFLLAKNKQTNEQKRQNTATQMLINIK